jgi:2-methylcitrate dehydratase PrpD
VTRAVNATAGLAQFVAGSRWEDVPAAVRHESKRALLNILGAAFAGCRHAAIDHSLAVLVPFSGPPEASILGRGERADALTAAFVNAASANVLDFCDTHHPTIIHPTAPVAPALLALAERKRASGRDLLHALLLGIEAECRVGNAVSPWHYAHGWHITSTCGVIGAAAATGKLLGLGAEPMVRAIGLGATQACGLLESLGTMAKSVSVGDAARNGIVAALLAERGFAAAPATLEGERGFTRVMGENADPSAIVRDLGTVWEATRNAYKPYPCGIVLHPVIDAMLELRSRHELRPEQVARVTVRGHPLLRQRTDRKRPRSGSEAQVSLQHTVAVCLIHGKADVSEYTDARANEPAVQALGDRVEVVDDASLGVEAIAVSLQTADGRTLTHTVQHAVGSLGRPMTDAQIEAKVRTHAAMNAPTVPVDRLIDAVWALDRADDAGAIARLSAALPNA